MGTVKRFEDLEVWEKSRVLNRVIWKIICSGTLAKDFKLRDQMSGSCGSIMDNIAEGFERGGRLEFINFLSIAKGSAGELRSQVHRAFDRNHISEEMHSTLIEQIEEVGRMLGGFMAYLNESEIKGKKFQNRN